MGRWAAVGLAASAVAAVGCGAQQLLLGTQGSFLFTTQDVLVPPGEETPLRARLQGGDMLRGQPGYVIWFQREGEPIRAAQTDEDGVASAGFTPPAPGDYRFRVEAAPVGFAGDPPHATDLLVACRAPDTPIVIVDMDKTLVASGFHVVLLGNPDPMAGSADVLKRLAAAHTIAYLTHRPDYFGPKSKAWLRDNGYPDGPVLLSTVEGFLKGSGAFKSDKLKVLREKFTKIEVGIGDKVSDAQAYHENGLKSFLILPVPEAATPEALVAQAESLQPLPDAVQVVAGWDEVAKALFEGAAYPRSAMERRLKDLAEARRQGAAAPK